MRLWDVDSQQEIATLTEGNSAAFCVVFSPDGHTLAAGCSDRTVVLWDVATGRVKDILRGHSAAVIALAFSPDGATLAAGCNDGNVTVWDWANSRASVLTGHEGPVSGLTIAPDGQTLAAVVRANAASAGSVKLWDPGLCVERMTLRAETYHVSSGVLAAGGRRLVAGTSDGGVIVWDAATDQELKARGRR